MSLPTMHAPGVDRPMSEPLVCCIMLTRDRPAMAQRAVECFRSQTYERKVLFVLDTGKEEFPLWQSGGVYGEYVPGLRIDKSTIGKLRNLANHYANPQCLDADIIAHWDDDDYSNPNRLAEQVALLQASGAEAVGYSDMLFWDERPLGEALGISVVKDAKCQAAWLYSNPISRYALGTSLCYWRKAWERVAFDDVPVGEDDRWCRKVRVCSTSSMLTVENGSIVPIPQEPRMIASIHGGNTSSKITPGHRQWRRVPELDSYCRKHMRLEAK